MAPGRTARHTHAAHFVGGIRRFKGRYLIYKSTMRIFFGVVNWFLGEIFEKYCRPQYFGHVSWAGF